MAGVILVVLEQPEQAAGLLAAALRLAALCGAWRINAMLVRTPPNASVMQSEEVLTEQREAELVAAETARAAAVRPAFDAWEPLAKQAGLEVEWIDVDGMPEQVVEERGKRADFLVIQRPTQDNYGVGWQAMHAALFACDRPVLVVPPNLAGDFGRRVAIAWREDDRTIKAVLAGLRCLMLAEKVFAITGTHLGGTPDVPAILAEHEIKTELIVLPLGLGGFAAMLLAKVHELGADMLIMGAYAHTPLREFLLGGVTRHMLYSADIPVLMRH